MTMAETIAEIRRQGGLVYVPHPFDRLHSVPDYEHLLEIVEEIDILEVFNPRVALTAFNEEAERFAAKYRIVPGAGSDSHVAQGLGSVLIRVHDFEGPEEFLEAMRDADIVRKHKNLVYVQALKFLQTGGGRRRARRASRSRAAAAQPAAAAGKQRSRQDVMHAEGAAPGPSKKAPAGPASARGANADDRRRDPGEVPRARDPRAEPADAQLQDCAHCPRGNLMPVLGSGHPQADIFLLKYAPTAAEIEEGVAFYGRSGNALMKSFKRLGIDPLVVYGTLCVKCPVADPSLAGGGVRRAARRGDRDRPPRIIVVMGERALETLNELEVPLSRPLEPKLGEVQALTPTIDALYVPDIDDSLDSEESKREFWAAFRALGDWYAELPPYWPPGLTLLADGARGTDHRGAARALRELRRGADPGEKQRILDMGRVRRWVTIRAAQAAAIPDPGTG